MLRRRLMIRRRLVMRRQLMLCPSMHRSRRWRSWSALPKHESSRVQRGRSWASPFQVLFVGEGPCGDHRFLCSHAVITACTSMSMGSPFDCLPANTPVEVASSAPMKRPAGAPKATAAKAKTKTTAKTNTKKKAFLYFPFHITHRAVTTAFSSRTAFDDNQRCTCFRQRPRGRLAGRPRRNLLHGISNDPPVARAAAGFQAAPPRAGRPAGGAHRLCL